VFGPEGVGGLPPGTRLDPIGARRSPEDFRQRLDLQPTGAGGGTRQADPAVSAFSQASEERRMSGVSVRFAGTTSACVMLRAWGRGRGQTADFRF
jgi:hypothetical protein